MLKYLTLTLFIFFINKSYSKITNDTIFILFKNDKKYQLYDIDIINFKNIQDKKRSFYFNFSEKFDYINAILFVKSHPVKLICMRKNKFKKYKNKFLKYSNFKKWGYKEIDSLFKMKKVFLVDEKNIGLFDVKLYEVKLIDLRKPTLE